MIHRDHVSVARSTVWSQSASANRVFPHHGNNCFQVNLLANTADTKAERKPHALVVDDVADVTEMLAVLLSHAGYQVFTAHSAGAAMEAAREHHFDVIISDIGMPGMNGYELARAVRTLPGYERVPMVAVTGYSMFDDRERSLQSGFNAHMTKPIEPRALLDLIEQL